MLAALQPDWESAHSCYVIVNNASSTNPANTKALAIRFAS